MGIGKKKRWEEQERQKLADLYRYHQKSMMQIAMSILHRKEDAEDAVQNSILAISRHMDKLGDIEDYRTKAYVQTVVRNAAIDLYRKNQKAGISYEELIVEPIDAFDLEKVVCDSEEVKRVLYAIDTMDHDYREILTLYYLNEMKPREIADVLNRSYNTVRSQIHRGRQQLLKSLEGLR
ncbi:MAG: hypothetical protein DBY27_09340 [Clostridiaceae bacterium]|nr:MAG: hypothetical protein DBY27_09340 [Clostridiaceae bacterium]